MESETPWRTTGYLSATRSRTWIGRPPVSRKFSVMASKKPTGGRADRTSSKWTVLSPMPYPRFGRPQRFPTDGPPQAFFIGTAQPPLPLHEFLPAAPSQPPCPLQAFCPLQECFAAADAQPPFPLQEFLPAQPLSPALQPPLPLHEFIPLQTWTSLAALSVSLAAAAWVPPHPFGPLHE